MNTDDTLQKMQEMRLLGMLNAWKTNLDMPSSGQWTTDELIHHLIQAEWEDRINRKVQRHLKAAKFRYQACIEQVKFAPDRNLDKNMFMRLADCSFIQRKENIIITGATGVGKSYIASAIGNQACLKGFKVAYFNTAKLFNRLKIAKADNSYQREITRIEKQDILILDDFGLHTFDQQTRLMLLEIIEDRHGSKPTIITSQFPINTWHEVINDHTIADAVLDRLVHHAQKIELKGESLRKKAKVGNDYK